MLRGGTLSKRDSFICALCRNRISLHRPTAPSSRLFSVSTRFASENDPYRASLFSQFSPASANGGFGNTSAVPTSKFTSTTTGSPGVQQPNSSYRPQDLTATSFVPGKYVSGLAVFNRRPVDDSLLNAHEARARQTLLKQKIVQPIRQHPSQQPRPLDDSILNAHVSKARNAILGQNIAQQAQSSRLPNDVLNKPHELGAIHGFLTQKVEPAQKSPVQRPLFQHTRPPNDFMNNPYQLRPQPAGLAQKVESAQQSSVQPQFSRATEPISALETNRSAQLPRRQTDFTINSYEMRIPQAVPSPKFNQSVQQAPAQQPRQLSDFMLGPREPRAREPISAPDVARPAQSPLAQLPQRPNDFMSNSYEFRARQALLDPRAQQSAPQTPALQPRQSNDFMLSTQESRAQEPIIAQELTRQVQQPRQSHNAMPSSFEVGTRQTIPGQQFHQPAQQFPAQQPQQFKNSIYNPSGMETRETILRQQVNHPAKQPPAQGPLAEQPRQFNDIIANPHESRNMNAILRQGVVQPVQKPLIQQSSSLQQFAPQRQRLDDSMLNLHELKARQAVLSQKVVQPSQQSRRLDDFLLNPSELRARNSIVARTDDQQGKQSQNQTQHGAFDPNVQARYVWNSGRQQEIESYLRKETRQLSAYGGTSKERPRTSPSFSVTRNDVESDFSIRSELNAKSVTDRAYAQTSTIGRFNTEIQPRPSLRANQSMDPDLAHDRGPSSTPQNALGREFGVRYPQSTESGSTDSWDDGDFWRSKQTVEDGYSTRSPDRIYDNQFQAESSLVQPQKPRGHPEPRTRHGLASLEAITQDSEGLQEWGQLARKPAVEKKFDDTDFWNALQSNASISQPPLADNRTTEPISPDPWAVSSTHRTPTTHSLGSIPEDKLGDFPVDSRVTESTSPDPKASIKTDDVPLSQKFKHYDFESENYSRHATRSRDDDYKHHRNRPEKFSEPEERFTSRRSGKSSRHSSRFMDDDGQDDYDRYMEKRRQKEQRKAQREAKRTEPIPILLPELISITALANALKVKPEDFLVQLEELGFERVTLDSLMSGETAALVAQEYGYEPTVDSGESQDLKPRPPSDQPWTLPSRPPVVTIMGHVDHGKTTILDYLRKSSVAAQEHGGITQHIGAFSVKLSSGKKITFLDTPGHAAFLTMRQRGANVTDIVVLVVAADDGIMPQTLEALKHARAAKVPIIVAINKIDADGAKIDAVKAALAKVGVDIEDFGGDVQVVCVSGKTGQGMDDLEENILALSEILDHRAEVDGPAEGWILESSLKVSGKVATILIKRGTLRPGDHIAAGLTWAKIRQLRNEAGVNIAEAPPGTPVEIFGWKDLPAAGDQVIQAPDENKAKIAVTYRQSIRGREKDAAEYENIAEARKAQQEKRAREKAANGDAVDLPEALPDKEGVAKIVNFVVKGDVHGSVEAVCAAIQEIGNHEVRPRILRSATGPITEFDVEHAATSKSIVINFSMKTPGHVSRMAESQGVRIFDHNVIYGVIDDVKAVLSEHLAPTITTHVVGDAEVLEIFPINTHGRVYKNVAGCRVRNGLVAKKHMFRVIRNGNTIFDGKLETLKHGKNDIMEIRKGSECGIGFEDFQDFAVGDQLQAYEINSTERKL